MKNFDWLQAFAMEQQEQPEPGVSADAAPQDEQERAEAFRALIQGPYKKEYDRQVQMTAHAGTGGAAGRVRTGRESPRDERAARRGDAAGV